MNATIFADNGEISAYVADGHLVLDALAETTIGHNRVHATKVVLHLAPHDAARLRRVLGSLLREAPRPSVAGPKLALAVRAKECVA